MQHPFTHLPIYPFTHLPIYPFTVLPYTRATRPRLLIINLDQKRATLIFGKIFIAFLDNDFGKLLLK